MYTSREFVICFTIVAFFFLGSTCAHLLASSSPNSKSSSSVDVRTNNGTSSTPLVSQIVNKASSLPFNPHHVIAPIRAKRAPRGVRISKGNNNQGVSRQGAKQDSEAAASSSKARIRLLSSLCPFIVVSLFWIL